MEGRAARPGRAGAAPGIDIRELAHADLDAAASLLATGMRDNPLHVRVFGRDPVRRVEWLRGLLAALLAHVHASGWLHGAWAEGRLVGVLGVMEPGRCRPSGAAALRFATRVVARQPTWCAARIARWLAAWNRNDPGEPHWHLGPMAVASGFRRQGIARRLMQRACRQADAHAGMAFLEADLAVNVRFYESLGFTMVRRGSVLGVPMWYMRRPPQARQPGALPPP